MENGVSIVLCCFNSKNRLNQTLKYLSLQDIRNISCELILVDNLSDDGTSDEGESIWASLGAPFKLKIVLETNPGLSHARLKGIYESNFDIVIFCDDDNWLDSNYVKISYDFMRKNSLVGALGGRGVAKCDVEVPNWFGTYQTSYACGCQMLESGDATKRQFLWGAGLVFRKNLLVKFINAGFTSLLSDRKGKELQSGGDSEICNWFVINGFKLWYLEELLYFHFIPKERLEISYLKKLHKGFDDSAFFLDKYRAVINWDQTGRMSFVSFIFKFLFYFSIKKDPNTAMLLELNNRFTFITFDSTIRQILDARKNYFVI